MTRNFSAKPAKVKVKKNLRMSRCLCNWLQGAGLPVEVKAMDDRVNDAIRALHVHEADHGASSASDLYKATFNDIGGAQFPPQVPGEAEERQEFG